MLRIICKLTICYRILIVSGFLVLLNNIAFAETGGQKCVKIYYDRSKDPSFKMGKSHAIMIANLLGHFPKWQRIISPVERYQVGDLDNCSVNFYIGSYYDNVIPKPFRSDYLKSKSKVVWLGYNFWQVPKFSKVTGLKFAGFKREDLNHLDINNEPGFYRLVDYKGVEFQKKLINNSDGSFDNTEVAAFKIIKNSKVKVLAGIRHSSLSKKLPWATQLSNRYVIAENPLSYIHESDRYLVFADLLFDILDEKPLRTEKLAVIRLEDIHVFVNKEKLRRAINILEKAGAYPVLSLIPQFKDPKQKFLPAKGIVDRNLNEDREFVALLQSLKTTTFAWHGVTHQNSIDSDSSNSQISGEGFEFWNNGKDRQISKDSASFVLDRLNDGDKIIEKMGLKTSIWITPHYKASALDNLIFGRLFDWTMGRTIIIQHKKFSRFPTKDEVTELKELLEKPNFYKNVKPLFTRGLVNEDDSYESQFFSYEIYGDFYGQHVLPEDLGNDQPEINSQVSQTRDVNELLTDAKKVFVLRDTWGSLFFHSFLLEKEGQEISLNELVNGIKAIGFKFVDLKEFAEKSKSITSPPIIYLGN